MGLTPTEKIGLRFYTASHLVPAWGRNKLTKISVALS